MAQVPTAMAPSPFCGAEGSVAGGCCSGGDSTFPTDLYCSRSSLLLSVQPADWPASSLSLLWVTRLPQVTALLLWLGGCLYGSTSVGAIKAASPLATVTARQGSNGAVATL